MTGNNTPGFFFIRDPLKFGDFIHTQKAAHPETNLKSPTNDWGTVWFAFRRNRFASRLRFFFSPTARPHRMATVNGRLFSTHTFSLINEKKRASSYV